MNRPLRLLLLVPVLALGTTTPGRAQTVESVRQAALQEAVGLEGEVERMAMELWDHSEIALREVASAELLARVLEDEGFTLEEGVADMPTAFVATWGSGAPVIGILAEFDALPGVGNAVVPRREGRHDGHEHGQGCGHNLFGAASVGAAMAVKRTMERLGMAGTVKLFGTPAEETVVGKVYMARDGIFQGLDAVLEWHPGLDTKVNNNPGLAMNNFEVEFRGQAAHGAADPWNGRSALDAVELMNHGVNLMREHIRPSARIHYVISAGGEAPNVVPEYARVWYYVRDTVRTEVEKNYAWVLNIAKASALATRTEHSVNLITGVHAYNHNRPLQEALQRNLEAVGEAGFTSEDQEFARELQEFLGIETKGLAGEIKPLEDELEKPSGGSTDVAEVSWITPTAGISVTTAAAGIPWHSWATSASHGTPGAVRGAWVAAKVLAMTGAELLADAELRSRATAFFNETTEGRPYASPLPPGQKPPVPTDVGGEVTCAHCRAAGEDVFVGPRVRRELTRYQRKGPPGTTRLLLDAIRARGAEDMRLLDIGGGVGILQHELLNAGASTAVNVEASPAYHTLCKEEAARRGHGDRIEMVLGDFVDLAPDVEPADIVTLDRVICCYPHMRVLVGASAARSSHLYGLVFPREHLLMRFGVGFLNLVQWVLRSAFRVFVHAGRDVDDELERRGFTKIYHATSLLWQVRLYERTVSIRPVS